MVPTDTHPEALQTLLDALPAPLEPLDVMMLDGFLCGVLLQRTPIAEQRWLAFALDIEGRAAPLSRDATAARDAVRQRHRLLREAIERRQWFDPWVYELETDAAPLQVVMPWAAGFALAAERFALPLDPRSAAAREALALVYRGLDPDDWTAARELQPEIETLEAPATLAEAVEELVRAVLLLADLISDPMSGPAPGAARGRPTTRSG